MSPSETTISEVAKSGDNENYTVHWCPNCKTPVIAKKGLGGVVRCPRCDSLVNYFSSDLRPVFPEERLLLGLLEDDPDKYIDKNIWANNSRYFLDGKSYPDAKITNLDKANSDSIVKSEMVCKFLIASTSVCPAYAAFLICLWFRAISASPGALSSSSLTAGL